MATTQFMLQSNPFLFHKQFNNPTLVSHPIMGLNCTIRNRKSNAAKGIDKYLKKVEVNNERVLIWRSIENILKTLKKPVITGVVLLGLLLLCDYGCQHALAASGGSMGGGDFSSSDFSSSSSSDDDSYSSSYYNYGHGDGDSYISNSNTKTSSSLEPSVETRLSHVVYTVIIIVAFFFLYLSVTKKYTSVLKLQVGLVGTARSLQRDLNVIAQTADTSKPN